VLLYHFGGPLRLRVKQSLNVFDFLSGPENVIPFRHLVVLKIIVLAVTGFFQILSRASNVLSSLLDYTPH
jgi:hypothetical protein